MDNNACDLYEHLSAVVTLPELVYDIEPNYDVVEKINISCEGDTEYFNNSTIFLSSEIIHIQNDPKHYSITTHHYHILKDKNTAVLFYEDDNILLNDLEIDG